jgi:GNAT superfamily N-acetyltransferase
LFFDDFYPHSGHDLVSFGYTHLLSHSINEYLEIVVILPDLDSAGGLTLFYELDRTNFKKAQPLLEQMDGHLVLASIFDGSTPARIFVDHPSEPKTVFTGFHARMFLLGSPDNPAFNQALHNHLLEQAIPEARANGGEAFIFHLDSDAWLPQLELILAGLYPLERKREYYSCIPRQQDVSSLLPAGFQIRQVDSRLVEDAGLENLELLLEELCSERTSVDDFLDKSFGICVLNGPELAGWCLSEYNQAGRCEVGVATLEKYQRQGLGTVTTLALLDQAARRGYRQVGWHCWSDNLPSRALARRAGFELVHKSSVYLCLFDLSVQLALHGHHYHQAGDLEQALDWYKRSIEAGSAPAWVLYNTACCQALSGDRANALKNVRLAIERGFGPIEHIRSDTDLKSLHDEPGWGKLFP